MLCNNSCVILILKLFLLSAVEAYAGEEYEKAINYFETALKLFHDALIECQAMCEGEFDGGAEFLSRKSFHDHTVGMSGVYCNVTKD